MNRVALIRISALVLTVLFASHGLRAAGPDNGDFDCKRSALVNVLTRYEARLQQRRQQALQREIGRQRRIEQEQARTLNREDRIERALKVAVHRDDLLKPSEIRVLRKAEQELLTENRTIEAGVIAERVQRQEQARKRPSKKQFELDAGQAKLINENIIMSNAVRKLLADLPPKAREVITKDVFLKIAQNAANAGRGYTGTQKIGNYRMSEYRKMAFSVGPEYRVVFRPQPDGKAVIETVGTRESVYRGKFRPLSGHSQ